MVDAKHGTALSYCDSQPTDLRRKIPGGDAGHNYQCGEAMEVRDTRANGPSRNLGIVPNDGEGHRGIAEHAEVEAVVGVLPDVLPVDDQIFSKGLLQPGVELVSKPCRRVRRNTGNQGRDN